MILASAGAIILSIALISVSVLLIGLILLQKNRGSGLSGAFGGVGGHSAFGTKTGDMLTWVTVGLTTLFMLLAIVGNYVFEPVETSQATPAAPATVYTYEYSYPATTVTTYSYGYSYPVYGGATYAYDYGYAGCVKRSRRCRRCR